MNDSRKREHGVIDEQSQRIVGMDPEQVGYVVKNEEDFKYPLKASSLEPPEVFVEITDEKIGDLSHGLGANLPSPGQGNEAFPCEDDEVGWKHFFECMSYAGIKWVRYWLSPEGITTDGKFDFEHEYFHRLYRLHEWAEKENVEIMLELCKIPSDYTFDEVYDAPADNKKYVEEFIIPLLKHLVQERQLTKITRLCLFNEPFNADVTPFIFCPQKPETVLEYYLELHEILKAAMRREKLDKVGLIGPNTANMFQRTLEMYEEKGLGDRVTDTFTELDVHMWRMRFDYYPYSKRWPGYTMTKGIEKYLRPTLAASKRMGKELALTEVGAMYYNENKSSSRTTRHDAFLNIAEQIVRAINCGVSGALVWSFANSGKIDGQWGWVGTRENNFAKVPNLLNGYAVLMKHQRAGGQINCCSVDEADFSSFISTAAVSDGHGITIWLINDHPTENINVKLKLPDKFKGQKLKLFRKDFDPELKELGWVSEKQLILPGMSLNCLSS